MKILFGVQATGNGHISRSKEVIESLKELGHEVKVVFSGREPNLAPEIADIFQPYEVCRGLTFVTYRGRIRLIRTAMQTNLRQLYKDVDAFSVSDYDFIVTDFEPVTARLAAKHGMPSVGIGHQYAFCYDIPVVRGHLTGKLILQKFAPAAYPLGLHWDHFNHSILPPIMPRFLMQEQRVAVKGKILVYLPFEEREDNHQLIEPFTDYDFYVYAKTSVASDEGHIHYRPFSRHDFLRDFMESSGVVTNAGFELPSEALHLGKKLLVKPLYGQVEQESNALAVSELKLGTVMSRLSRETVANWLESGQTEPQTYPNVAWEIARWLDKGKLDSLSRLSTNLWEQTGSRSHDVEPGY